MEGGVSFSGPREASQVGMVVQVLSNTGDVHHWGNLTTGEGGKEMVKGNYLMRGKKKIDKILNLILVSENKRKI